MLLLWNMLMSITCVDQFLSQLQNVQLLATNVINLQNVLLQKLKCFSSQVAETCQLALERINWLQSKEKETEKLSKNPYFSTDPAPPSTGTDISRLQAELLDESLPLFNRYRAMFSLRNIGTKEAVVALAKGKKTTS